MFLSILCFALCGIVLMNSHTDVMHAILAQYNYGKNDINKAMNHYEKAFDLGYKNSDARMKYINLLLNSPINETNQKRIIKFVNIPENDSAKYKAEIFLSDLKLEIYKKYAGNYITQVPYNQKIIRWSHNPITYKYYNSSITPEYYINEINNAFLIWGEQSENTLKFKEVNNNPDIIIRFNNQKTKVGSSEKYIAAYTQPIIKNSILKNMTVDFFITTPDDKYFTPNQVYNIALHEIGHAIGIMGHSDYRKSVMNMTTDYVILSNDLRKDLTIQDINTLKLLYNTIPEISDLIKNDAEYISSIVIGKQEEIANTKIKEAKKYIKKAPNLPTGYIDLADAYVSLEEYPKAVSSLNRALSLANNDEIISMIYYNLAVSYFLMSDFEQAKSCLGKSGSLQDSESAQKLLAEIYYALDEKQDAINIYKNLILKNQSDIEYVILLTNIYVRNHQYIKARLVLKEFISKNPNERHNPKLSPYGIIKLFL